MVKIDTNRTVFEKAKIKTNNNPNYYLWQLECDDMQAIKMALASTICYEIDPNSDEFMDAMIRGMSGRLCDLEDTIDIEYVRYM